METAATGTPEDDREKPRHGPTRGEYQMLLVVATAFVLIVGSFLFVALQLGCRRMDLEQPPPQSASPE